MKTYNVFNFKLSFPCRLRGRTERNDETVFCLFVCCFVDDDCAFVCFLFQFFFVVFLLSLVATARKQLHDLQMNTERNIVHSRANSSFHILKKHYVDTYGYVGSDRLRRIEMTNCQHKPPRPPFNIYLVSRWHR